MRAHVDAVLLDFDGTLVDTAPDLVAALNRLLEETGRAPVAFERFRALAGEGAKRLLLRALAAQGERPPGDEAVARLVERLVASYYDIQTERVRLFPSVAETLERFGAAGVPLGLCTNRYDASTRLLLAHFGIDRLFGTVRAGDRVARRKPDPGHLHEALADLGARPERAVMVGDGAADVEASRGAGVAVVAVSYGYSPVPVRSLGADAVIDEFAALPTVLERLFPRD